MIMYLPYVKTGENMENRLDEVMHSIDDIYADSLKLLSQPEKDFEIHLLGEDFYFSQAITSQEYEELVILRHKFIKKVLKYCINKYIDTDDIESFSLINDLFLGPDPKEFQLEKIEENNSYIMTDLGGEPIKSIALDTDTIYVQSERPDLDFEDESVRSEFIDSWSKKLEQGDAQKDKDGSSGV